MLKHIFLTTILFFVTTKSAMAGQTGGSGPPPAIEELTELDASKVLKSKSALTFGISEAEMKEILETGSKTGLDSYPYRLSNGDTVKITPESLDFKTKLLRAKIEEVGRSVFLKNTETPGDIKEIP